MKRRAFMAGVLGLFLGGTAIATERRDPEGWQKVPPEMQMKYGRDGRRYWYIDMSHLPPQKANEFMDRVRAQFKARKKV